MKKLILIFVLSLLTIQIYSQNNYNSLDLASPAYTIEQREKIISENGLYFITSFYQNLQINGSFYKGTGYISSSTNLDSGTLYYCGLSQISWEEYYARVGLQSYVDSYYKIKKQRTIGSTLGISGLIIGEIAFIVGGFDLLYTPYGDGPRDYTFGSKSNDCIATFGGLAVTVLSTIGYFSQPKMPEPISFQYLALISNRYNKNLGY